MLLAYRVIILRRIVISPLAWAGKKGTRIIEAYPIADSRYPFVALYCILQHLAGEHCTVAQPYRFHPFH